MMRTFNNDPLNLIDNYRSKSPNVPKHKKLIDLPNPYQSDRRNIQSESQKRRVIISERQLYKTFIEERPYEDAMSEVKFSRSGMKVKERAKVRSNIDENSIYDP